jgi:hypothetical protein
MFRWAAGTAVGLALVPAAVAAGTLSWVTAPPNVSFTVTLNGTDRSTTAPQALDVSDQTASSAGWNITATSTTFSTGGGAPHTLPASATTVQSAPTTACDSASVCTPAVNTITYPYALPAAASPPTATKMFNAAAGTGMLNQTVTATWRLAIPGNTFAGTYTSTWTISLVSGP